MAKQYDSTLNALIDAHVADWAAFLAARAGVPPGPAVPLDTDLSITRQADRLFRLDGPVPAVLHLELESTGRTGIPDELLLYNVAARLATGHLPVESVVVLLRPKANARDLTGLHEVRGPDGDLYLRFRYRVVRVWQERVEALLAAGAGLAPLAVLTDEAAADLDGAFGRLDGRLRRPDVPRKLAEDLLGTTRVLCGLRYDKGRVADIFRRWGMVNWEDSTTYMEVLERGQKQGETRGRAEGRAEGKAEGKAEEARRWLLRLGRKRFGPPPAGAEDALGAIEDLDRLERMGDRVIDAAGWDDLLSTP